MKFAFFVKYLRNSDHKCECPSFFVCFLPSFFPFSPSNPPSSSLFLSFSLSPFLFLLSFLPFFLTISLWIIWNKFSQNVVSFIENSSYVARGWLFAEILSLTQDIGMIRCWNTKIIGPLVCKMMFLFYSHRVYELPKLVITTKIWNTVNFQNVQKFRVQTEVEPITMKSAFFIVKFPKF